MNLNSVYDTLKSAIDSIDEVKLLDWYLDQDTTKGAITISPSVYLNFSNVVPTQLNNYKQQLEYQVEVIVFTKYLKPSSKISTNNVHFLIENRIHEELSFLCMEQIGFEPMKKEGKLRKSSLTYKHKIVQSIPKKAPANSIQKDTIAPVIETT